MVDHRPHTPAEIVEQFSDDELKINNDFSGKDFISVEQLSTPEELEQIFTLADAMKEIVLTEEQTGQEVSDPNLRELKNSYRYSGVAEIFYQPSTRTFTSFQSAAQWLGCQRIIAIQGMEYSSHSKGESLSDTVKTIQQTTASNVLILRHPDDSSSYEAASHLSIPVINAGSGRHEHPTQAVLDLYTIREALNRTDGLTVTMTGDLRNGRTIKSLAKLLVLASNNVQFNFISPEVLQMPPDVLDYLQARGAKIHVGENGDLDEAMRLSDVLYVTRIQSEWFQKQAMEDLKVQLGDKFERVRQNTRMDLAKELGESEYKAAVEGYVIDKERLKLAKPDMIIMHPLPRVGEISYDVDDDPRAVYIGKQMRNGLYTRMALLNLVK